MNDLTFVPSMHKFTSPWQGRSSLRRMVNLGFVRRARTCSRRQITIHPLPVDERISDHAVWTGVSTIQNPIALTKRTSLTTRNVRRSLRLGKSPAQISFLTAVILL